MKKTLSLLICFFVMTINVSAAPQLDIKAKSVILTEASTGNVMYEQNSDERLPMASVTKVIPFSSRRPGSARSTDLWVQTSSPSTVPAWGSLRAAAAAWRSLVKCYSI